MSLFIIIIMNTYFMYCVHIHIVYIIHLLCIMYHYEHIDLCLSV